MKVLVVGAGAVGGYFGGRLFQAGRDVTFLVRPAKAEQIRKQGLEIVSPHGNATLHPPVITADQITEPYDLIFVSVKSYALASAIEDFSKAVGPETMIYPMLNGMRHMDQLKSRFGDSAVIGGVCLVATTIDDAGRIVQLSELHKLIYGELDGKISDRMRRLDETMRDAGFYTQLSTNIVQAMWDKWVQLASLGLITCLMRGSIGEIVAAPDGAAFCRNAVNECARIAAACGHSPDLSFLEKLSAMLSEPGSALTSSMYRDLEKGASVEVDTILGDLLDHGRSHSIASPLLEAGCLNLRVYQSKREILTPR